MKPHPTRRLAARRLAASALLISITTAFAADLPHLRCEYLDNPPGIDAQKPRLS